MRFFGKIPNIVCSITIVVFVLLCGAAPSYAVRQINPDMKMPVVGPPALVVKKKSFHRWRSGDVLKTFKKHGLEVVDVAAGMVLGSPGSAETIIFLMPSFGRDTGSMVSSFDSVMNLNEAAKYYSKMNDNAASPVWWIFKKENILVLISRKVPRDKAGQYKEALRNMRVK